MIVALTVSPTAALLTALLFLGIQQLEGNFLTPRIQGDALHVHPIIVFVGVPALAVLRVDFFRVGLAADG